MIYCPECEIWWGESDLEGGDWIDEDGTAWCPCGCELRSIDPEPTPEPPWTFTMDWSGYGGNGVVE